MTDDPHHVAVLLDLVRPAPSRSPPWPAPSRSPPWPAPSRSPPWPAPSRSPPWPAPSRSPSWPAPSQSPPWPAPSRELGRRMQVKKNKKYIFFSGKCQHTCLDYNHI